MSALCHTLLLTTALPKVISMHTPNGVQKALGDALPPTSTPPTLSYDLVGLAINRAFQCSKAQSTLLDKRYSRTLVAQDLEWDNANVPLKLSSPSMPEFCQDNADDAP